VLAGTWVPHLARIAQSHELSGIEYIIGIPGSVVGLITMNGGSKRQTIGASIKKVKILFNGGNELILTKKECEFDYRDSVFKNHNYNHNVCVAKTYLL